MTFGFASIILKDPFFQISPVDLAPENLHCRALKMYVGNQECVCGGEKNVKKGE